MNKGSMEMYSEDATNTGKPQAPLLGDDRFSKRQLDYFRLRTEAYISIWEEAALSGLIRCDQTDCRSIYHIRNALQRVYWGNHLSEDQQYRLIQADLRIFADPGYGIINRHYRNLIEELLEQHDLIYLYREDNLYQYTDHAKENVDIDYKLCKWENVLIDLGDHWENEEETKESLIHRWELDRLFKTGRLNQDQIDKLVELDQKVMLSPNSTYMNRFERRFIYIFLMSRGVFDGMPEE